MYLRASQQVNAARFQRSKLHISYVNSPSDASFSDGESNSFRVGAYGRPASPVSVQRFDNGAEPLLQDVSGKDQTKVAGESSANISCRAIVVDLGMSDAVVRRWLVTGLEADAIAMRQSLTRSKVKDVDAEDFWDSLHRLRKEYVDTLAALSPSARVSCDFASWTESDKLIVKERLGNSHKWFCVYHENAVGKSAQYYEESEEESSRTTQFDSQNGELQSDYDRDATSPTTTAENTPNASKMTLPDQHDDWIVEVQRHAGQYSPSSFQVELSPLLPEGPDIPPTTPLHDQLWMRCSLSPASSSSFSYSISDQHQQIQSNLSSAAEKEARARKDTDKQWEETRLERVARRTAQDVKRREREEHGSVINEVVSRLKEARIAQIGFDDEAKAREAKDRAMHQSEHRSFAQRMHAGEELEWICMRELWAHLKTKETQNCTICLQPEARIALANFAFESFSRELAEREKIWTEQAKVREEERISVAYRGLVKLDGAGRVSLEERDRLQQLESERVRIVVTSRREAERARKERVQLEKIIIEAKRLSTPYDGTVVL